jgi:hypothetical protein
MANIPSSPYQLPGVYGPTGTEISKTDKGYAISWSGGKVWGDPHIEGSPREIARDIITRYAKVIAMPDHNMTMEDISWYGAIKVKWKPELIVSLYKRLQIVEGVDAQLFINELTKELQPLVKLLPFV